MNCIKCGRLIPDGELFCVGIVFSMEHLRIIHMEDNA